ncbi:GNAT family N-acetyltransferase [Pimelobacter simplex]|uniref:GNAT family N-acetyltransferase n=1 Tax=Nocardioides simplex TaxID=2045 RepID=UPI00214FC7FF|nr:GNAT family N-acetyltransferase [Pimelobacter simplex]UUW89052.1 GNAT family N-acetyltransferase [Pimelobacter simplex]UUW98556.1 GNAT family N-acetyltransferase [Pimelobacter simplex]
MRPEPDGYAFSADRDRIDPGWVHRQLSEHAYWALGRPREVQDAANAGSRCYGVYDAASGAQVAFARVVTDGATFGWLCDVIVDPELRGHGLGTTLVAGVVADLEPLRLKRLMLATSTASGLYAQHGWTPLRAPETWMEHPGSADL